MKRTLLSGLMAFAIAIGIVATVPVAVGAVDVFEKTCSGAGGNTSVCGANKNQNESVEGFIKNIINVMLYLIGIIAVIMIIIGGIRYVTSNGDSGSIKSAKDTIMYAVIGLVVAIMAFAIVNFVVTAFK